MVSAGLRVHLPVAEEAGVKKSTTRSSRLWQPRAAELEAEFHPHGFNIGINDGIAAGQTVIHLHVHVIPRYHGDMDDPRGGVRGVIPAKQK